MFQLRLTSPHLPDYPSWHLSVDGMSPEGPNLSHWPGNRTPARFKADLSTGICLNFAKASPAEQEEFLAGATTAMNDHYDTDGFLSLLAVLRPDVALPREEKILAAAATGDYQAFHGDAGFAVDRIVLNLAAAGSPVAAEFEGLTGMEKDFARYKWLLEHAETVLDEPDRFAVLFADELAAVRAQLDDPTILCAHRRDVGLALVRSPGSVHRMVLNTVAGDCYRVLHSEAVESEPLYRFHDRTESWFEVQSFHPPARRPLGALCAALQERESELEGSVKEESQWTLDPPNEPVPELYHGIPGAQNYGQITRKRTPSAIAVDEVEERFTGFFGTAS